eukprot:833984-Rhodomonas_salina.1
MFGEVPPLKSQHQPAIPPASDIRSTAAAKMHSAYAAIAQDLRLHVSYPLCQSHCKRAKNNTDILPNPLTSNTHQYLLPVGQKLGPGFPQVVLYQQRLNCLKSAYR